jgi:hypothetical protein
MIRQICDPGLLIIAKFQTYRCNLREYELRDGVIGSAFWKWHVEQLGEPIRRSVHNLKKWSENGRRVGSWRM